MCHPPGMSDHVRVEPAGKKIRVSLGGVPIVDTDRALVVHEKGLPPRYYVPREDVRAELKPGGFGACPWKGKWQHLEVSAGGTTVSNGAWAYVEPTPVCEPIRDHVSFYADKMGSFEVG